jgi:hypothetical protein
MQQRSGRVKAYLKSGVVAKGAGPVAKVSSPNPLARVPAMAASGAGFAMVTRGLPSASLGTALRTFE